MSRKSKEEAEKTRARILASALSLFVKRGYEKTTFTDIAARLKMTKGAVYWHFETKESLLVALVTEMLEKFQRRLGEFLPKGELTFRAVAGMMVQSAERIVHELKCAAFFMLMKTQIKWGADSMSATREKLMSRSMNGPYHTFIKAVENDIAAGRVRKGVNPVAVASVAVSVWDGLVQSKIERFLECELGRTLHNTYEAMWNSIKTGVDERCTKEFSNSTVDLDLRPRPNELERK